MEEVNCKLSRCGFLPLVAIIVFTSLLLQSCNTNAKNETVDIMVPQGWELLWGDEFNTDFVDTSKWKVEELIYKKGAFKKENVRIEENIMFFKSSIDDSVRYGGRVMSKEWFSPPVRLEIRFKPIMKPGSFIALWLYPSFRNSMYASYNKQVYKEFDFLECGGGENIVTDEDIKITAHATVHSWHAAQPFVSGSNVRAQENVAPQISVGNPVQWQELRFDWENRANLNGNEARFYWRASGKEWGEPIFKVRPESDFFAIDSKMNELAFGDVKYVDILKNVWDDPMAINMFSHPRAPEAWLSQESLGKQNRNTWGGITIDPSDYPFDMPIDYIRVYVPEGDPRLQK